MNASLLADVHMAKLGLFEVCRHPQVVERSDIEQELAGLNSLAHFDGSSSHQSANRRNDAGIAKVLRSVEQRRLRPLEIAVGCLDPLSRSCDHFVHRLGGLQRGSPFLTPLLRGLYRLLGGLMCGLRAFQLME